MIGEGANAATAGIQIPHAEDWAGGGECERAGREHEDLFDGGGARGCRAHEELALAGTRVKEPHGCVVRAGENKVGICGGHLAGADVVGMGGEGDDVGLGGDVPELDGGVIGAGEDLGRRERGELCDMDGLPVGVECAEDGARGDIEHLDKAGVVAGDEEPSVRAEMGAAGDVGEAGDSLDDLLCAGRVDLHAGRGGDGVRVGPLRGKVDGGDGRVLPHEHGASERAPVAGLGAAAGRGGALAHDGLVVHSKGAGTPDAH